MAMKSTMISKIAIAARKFVLGRNDNGLSNPYDLNECIKNTMNIQIFYASGLPFDGCIKWNDSSEKPVIIVSRDDSYYRQEFTIAHELGHLLLHWKWSPADGLTEEAKKVANKQYNILGVLYRGGSTNSTLEKEANEFSAEFLMPVNGVKALYKQAHVKDLDAIKFNVSEKFNVSTGAAYTRLEHLQNEGQFRKFNILSRMKKMDKNG